MSLTLSPNRSGVKHDAEDFDVVASLLRLTTKYAVEHIRKDILRGMTAIWPRTLSAWEFREADATDAAGVYKPRSLYPHPMSATFIFRAPSISDTALFVVLSLI